MSSWQAQACHPRLFLYPPCKSWMAGLRPPLRRETSASLQAIRLFPKEPLMKAGLLSPDTERTVDDAGGLDVPSEVVHQLVVRWHLVALATFLTASALTNAPPGRRSGATPSIHHAVRR